LDDFIQSFFKSLSWTALGLLGLVASCTGGAIGGISLDAPIADLEGGTSRETFICGTLDGASQGDLVRITNISDPAIAPVDVGLDASGQYSAEVCLQMGQSANIEGFDSAGNPVSETRTVSRLPGVDIDCPDPTVSQDNCP
jgi:hypothetical protein